MFVVMVALALSMMLGTGATAHAQPIALPAAVPLVLPAAAIPAKSENKCADYAGLSNRIVMCIRDTIDVAAVKFYGEDTTGDGRPDTGFFRLVSRAITGFLTLTVIIYGILAAYGMLEKPGRDVMLLMVKLSIVTGLVVQSDVLYSTSLRMMDSASAAVVSFAPNTGEIVAGMGADRLECINNMKEASNLQLQDRNGNNRANYASAWIGMDCVLDTVIGIKVDQKMTGQNLSASLKDLTTNKKTGEKPGMARGLINFFFSSMQSSIMGVLLAIIGFVFIYTLIWLVLKAMFVYLAGYIGIAFMMIFAPVFIPLVLFRVTSEYFKKWIKLTLAFALQPIIILAFVTFAVSAIDFAVFSGDYSVMYRIAGNESRAATFNVNEYLEKHQLVKKEGTELAGIKTSTETPRFNESTIEQAKNKLSGLFGDVKNSDCGKNLANPNLNADPAELQRIRESCSSYPIKWWRNSINWNKMAAVREPQPPPAERVPDTTNADGSITKGDGPTVTETDLRGRTIAREVFAAVIFATLAVLCINGLLTVIPSMVNDLVGESFQSPNLFAEISRRGSTGGGTLTGLLSRGGKR